MMNSFPQALTGLAQRRRSVMRRTGSLFIHRRWSRLFLALPVLLSVLVLTSGQTAFAATRRVTPAAPQQTIVWLGSQGQIDRSWSGSVQAAQVIEQQENTYLAKLHAADQRAARQAASPLIARESNSDCAADTGTVYVKLWNNESGSAGGVCFGTAGDTGDAMNIYQVSSVTTGNNVASFAFVAAGAGSREFNVPYEFDHVTAFRKHVTVYPDTPTGFFDDVVEVQIYSPTTSCVATTVASTGNGSYGFTSFG